MQNNINIKRAIFLPIDRPYSHLLVSQMTVEQELLLVRQLRNRSFSSLVEGSPIFCSLDGQDLLAKNT